MDRKRQTLPLAILVAIVTLVAATTARAEPVSATTARTVAGNFLSGKDLGRTLVFGEEPADSVAVRAADGRVLAWVHTLIGGGYVITSADTDLKPVLGFSLEGSFTFEEGRQNIPLHLLKWDVKRRLAVAGDPSDECRLVTESNRRQWQLLSSASYEGFAWSFQDSGEQWGPWIETDWDQTGRYNDFCPYDSSTWKLGRRPVGCVATSLAQIVYYWEWPSRISFDSSDEYEENGIHFDDDASSYGFPTASTLDAALSEIRFDDDDDEVAYLCFGLGVKVKMSYGVNGSGAFFEDTHYALLTELSFGSATLSYKGTGLWSDIRAEVIRNLKDGMPVQIGIADPDPDPDAVKRHSVIVDGYRESDGYFHVNWGWGNSSSTWYDLPEGYGGYEIVFMALHDVSPSKGWGQERVDARNSARVRFGAPADSKTKDKWIVQCPTNYSFEGIAVGAAGKTYAVCNPNVRNDGNPSYLWVIDWDGKVLKKVEFTSEDRGLSYPAQNSHNEVFVASPLGNVYRVDPTTDKPTKIFTLSGASFEVPIKIDKLNRIFLTTDGAVYCISRSGGKAWSAPFTPRKNGQINYPPAIDVANDRVLVAYTDFDDETSYLSVLDIDTGEETDYRTWFNITKFSKCVKTPVVDSEGIVYLSVLGALYAVDPDDSLNTVAGWDCPGSTPNPVAIGRNRRIYISYWEDKAGTWYRTVGAFDPNFNTGEYTQAWAIRFEEDDEYDNIREPYFAANDVVVFTHTMENGTASDTHTLYAYRDNGSTASKLWEYDLDESGGRFAFAPEATIITIPVSGNAHTMTALTEPDRLGMGWSENGRPGTISNTGLEDKGEIDATQVTLSWTCSDPDDNSLTYDVFFGEDDQVNYPAAIGLTTTSVTIRDLDPGTRYRWRVVASDGQSRTFSEIWSFSTEEDDDPPPPPPPPPPPVNTAPEITTAASADPQVVEIGRDVTLSVTATDADDDPLTYAWEFGDGLKATGGTVKHSFSAAGVYTVLVRVSDGTDTATSTVEVTVAATFLPLNLKGTVGFKPFKPAKDNWKVKGELDLPTDFDPTGKSIRIEVGGVSTTLTLDRKGKGVGVNAKVKLKYKKKTGRWRFEASVKKRRFADTWEPYGVEDNTTKKFVTIPTWLTVDGVHYMKSVPCYYKAKAGKSGSVK